MHHFLHGVLILQDAKKNHSQYEEILEAGRKKSLFARQIKRAQEGAAWWMTTYQERFASSQGRN